MGEFYYESFEDYDHSFVGKALYTFYLVIMFVTMFNFIIAILSDTFAIYSEK